MNEPKKIKSANDFEFQGETGGKAAELSKGGVSPIGRPHPPTGGRPRRG
jgi:hypothetical protein